VGARRLRKCLRKCLTHQVLVAILNEVTMVKYAQKEIHDATQEGNA
jgi:hypothetical protein